MKSIKQGRGPSLLGGIMGIFMVLIGIVWTSIAMRADFLFAMFGVIWTLMALAITIYNFIGATRRNRPSMYDITDGDEEPDPLNELFG
ncbi:MAG: zinc ribbon domain-containing protein, partial [Eubacteriales bacterium]|nr:zinc ribbon domain-containing protein [Eubacteriales bacterium]